MGTKEIWINRFGEIYEAWFGPCSCHPGDLILTWGNRYNKSVSYSFINEKAARRFLVNRGYESLENYE